MFYHSWAGDRHLKFHGYLVIFHPGQGWLNGAPYVDVLHPDAARVFLDIAYEPYRARFERDFGTIVPGCFTDEPHFNPAAPSGSLSALTWTPDLPQSYRARYGEDLVSRLPELIIDTARGYRSRIRYWNLVSRLFAERWVRPLYEWCDKHGLAFTGHFWEHDFGPQHTGSIMLPLVWQHVPGLDLLGQNVELSRMKSQDGHHVPQQMGNIAMVKAVSSVAHQMARSRVLSETYGGAGWEMSFADQKAYAEWQAVLGVNYLNPHLGHYSLRGERKHDHPPSFRAHQPWWRDYPVVHEYLSRLNYALSQGSFESEALVIHPMTSLWIGQRATDPLFARAGTLDAVPRNLNSSLRLTFDHLLKDLSASGWSYDLGDELVMEELGRVDGDSLRVGEMAYKVVVLPPCKNLMSNTVELLTKWLDCEGKIAALSPVPQFVDGEKSSKLEELLARCMLFSDAASLLAWLPSVVGRRVRIDTREPRSNICTHVRCIAGGRIVFAANMGPFDHTEASMRIAIAVLAESGSPQEVVVERWDLRSGEITAVPARPAIDEEMGESVEITLDFAPSESHLLIVRREAETLGSNASEINRAAPDQSAAVTAVAVSGTSKTGRHEPEQVTRRIVLDDRWDFMRLDPNALVLDTCEYRFDSRDETDAPWHGPTPIAALRRYVRRRYGLPEMTFHDVQPWRKFADHPPTTAADKLSVRFTVSLGFDPSETGEIDLVVEEGNQWSVKINGVSVSQTARWWLDPAFCRIPARSALRAGINTIEMVRCYREDMSFEPAYLIGDFAVETSDFRQFRLAPERGSIQAGSWVHQGYPFFAGRAVYSQAIEIETSWCETGGERIWLELSDLPSACVRVRVNGSDVGALAWSPHRAEITQYVRPGSNGIELEVVNSLRNLLGPHHDNGRRTLIGPGAWQYDQNWEADFKLVADGLANRVSLIFGR